MGSLPGKGEGCREAGTLPNPCARCRNHLLWPVSPPHSSPGKLRLGDKALRARRSEDAQPGSGKLRPRGSCACRLPGRRGGTSLAAS